MTSFLSIPTNASSRGGINWMQTCQQLDPIIIPSCSSLVIPNNVLTVGREQVKGCIQHGLALAGVGTFGILAFIANF